MSPDRHALGAQTCVPFFVTLVVLTGGALLAGGGSITTDVLLAGDSLLAGEAVRAETTPSAAAVLLTVSVLVAGLCAMVLGTSFCIFRDPESKVGLEFIRSQSPVPSRFREPS